MTSRHLALVFLLIFVGASGVRASSTDVSAIFINKEALFQQNSPAKPVAVANPFSFQLGATASKPNSILSASFTPPSGPSANLTNDGLGNFFFDSGAFASAPALNAKYPNGAYTLNLQTVTAPTAFKSANSHPWR